MKLAERIDLFYEKANVVHGHIYRYDLSTYRNHSSPMSIFCKLHGVFYMSPNNHLAGQGCPKCGRLRRNRLTTEEFIRKAKLVHGDTYTYCSTIYGRNSHENVVITCSLHGDFLQSPNKHLQGHGCQSCGNYGAIPDTVEGFIKKAEHVHHSKYLYTDVKYVSSKRKITIICPEHGRFRQLPNNHLVGSGCPSCALVSSSLKQRMTQAEFEDKARSMHKSTYSYGTYSGMANSIEIICPEHGSFFIIRAEDHLYKKRGCSRCNQSHQQQQVRELLDSLGILYKENVRTIIPPYELDFYIPDSNLAIEINGLYWHSTKYKAKNYHWNKEIRCRELGINLLQFWHHEIGALVFSMIRAKLGVFTRTIYGRKTVIRGISSGDYRDFLRSNHLQGAINSSERNGLYFVDELVAVMGFSRGNHLDRFATIRDTRVIGGFTKLLKSFNKHDIVSFSANRYSDGNVYVKNGFSLERENKYTLYYTDGNSLFSRERFQRHKLKGVTYGQSVEKFLNLRGIYSIYGPGTKKWRLLNEL